MNFSNYTGDLDMNAKVGFKLGGGFEYAFDAVSYTHLDVYKRQLEFSRIRCFKLH